MLGNEVKNRTFKALVDFYAKHYSPGQIANQLCDVMDGMSTPVHAEAAQWTIDAARAMAGERSFWKRDCVHVLGDIRSAAVSYFERQKINPPDEVLFDIVQAVVLDFAFSPREEK